MNDQTDKAVSELTLRLRHPVWWTLRHPFAAVDRVCMKWGVASAASKPDAKNGHV